MAIAIENYFPSHAECTFKFKNKKALIEIEEEEKEKSVEPWELVKCSWEKESKLSPYGGGSRKRNRSCKKEREEEEVELDPEKVEPFSVRQGQKVNIVSLLTSSSREFLVDSDGNQVKVSSSLEGKYIFLIYLEIPVTCNSSQGVLCWALKRILPEWGTHVQLVVVPKFYPTPNLHDHDDELACFKSFLSGFPSGSCLAIPISDSASCRRVSAFIRNPGSSCLILDPSGIILQTSAFNFIEFGAASFPFTRNRISALFHNHSTWDDEQRPVLLENLLGVPVTHSLAAPAPNPNTILVSELKHRLVGLYLCLTGESMDRIHQAYQYCQANQLDFQVVMVYLPLCDDPSHFIRCANAALRDKGISSWWLLPFDDSTSRSLWTICERSRSDRLIIVGPGGQFVDTRAINIIKNSDSAPLQDTYPFAAEFLASQETDRLMNLTLDSLLSCSPTKCLRRVTQNANAPISRRYLEGKIVCVFVANCDDKHYDHSLERMADWCHEKEGGKNKKDPPCSNNVLVFVPFHSGNHMNKLLTRNYSDPRMSWLRDPSMSWLICRPDPDCEASIAKHAAPRGLRFMPYDMAFLVFGKDGKLFSMGSPHLSEIEANRFPPPGELYEQVLEKYLEGFNYQGDAFDYFC